MNIQVILSPSKKSLNINASPHSYIRCTINHKNPNEQRTGEEKIIQNQPPPTNDNDHVTGTLLYDCDTQIDGIRQDKRQTKLSNTLQRMTKT